MERRIGASIEEDDLGVHVHLVEQEAQAFVRFEMRRKALTIEQESGIGLDLLPSEARELGRKLLARADGADFYTEDMVRRRKKRRFPFSLLQNGKIMRPAHIFGVTVGFALAVFASEVYLFELGFFVMLINALGVMIHSGGVTTPQDKGHRNESIH